MKRWYFILLSISFIANNNIFSQAPQSEFRPYNNTNPQGVHQYGNVVEFPHNGIAEDFGPRQILVNNGTIYYEYQWHGGVDYNSVQNDNNNDLGDIIIALENGDITPYGVTNQNTKYIAVEGAHNIRHVHIFEGGTINQGQMMTTGGGIIKYMNAPYNDSWAIIFQVNGNYSAIGPETPTQGTVTFIDETSNQLTLNVNSNVVAGDPVAILGNSSGYVAHNHVEMLTQLTLANGNPVPTGSDLFAKDILEIIDHDDAQLEVQILQQNDINQGITLDYPGTEESTIQVRVGLPNETDVLNRYATVMNVDDVEILIKKDYQAQNAYQLIRGPWYKSRISHGARLNSVRENMTLSTSTGNNGNWGNIDVGGWNRTHMQPFAYANPNNANYTHHPWDEYYFADFATRIHKSDQLGAPNFYANCPESARYNDGRYHIYTKVTEVNNDVNTAYYNDPIEITIDNFKPFITKVQFMVGDVTLYDMYWNCSDDCDSNLGGIQPIGGITNNPYTDDDLSDYAFVIVNISEPLENLSMAMSTNGGDVPQNEFVVTHSENRRSWFIEINNISSYLFPGSSSGGDLVQLTFTGNDYPTLGYQPNDLLDLSNYYHPDNPSQNDDCVQMPMRIANGWDNNNFPSGQETAHHFSISCGGRAIVGHEDEFQERTVVFNGTCLLADFEYELVYDGCTVEFTNYSIGEPDDYFWTFGDGATSENSDPSHVYDESGCYDVTLTVNRDDGATSSFTQQVCITNCGGGDWTPEGIDCHINGPAQVEVGGTITLQAAVTGGVPPFSYEWDVTGDVTPFYSTEPNPQFTFSENVYNGDIATFDFEVTDALGTTCQTFNHVVTVSGGDPIVQLGVFGSFQANTYLYLAATLDYFNIVGIPQFQFTITDDINGGIVNSSPLQGAYDYEIPGGLPDGEYTACVTVTDDNGPYSDCSTFTIGIPPPPSPAMSLVARDVNDPTPYIIEQDDGAVFIGFEGSHPTFPYGWSGCSPPFEYAIRFQFDYLNSNDVPEIWENVYTQGINHNDWALGFAVDDCYVGTIAITATMWPTSCWDTYEEDVDYDYPFHITEPMLVTVEGGTPKISNIELEEACDPYLEAFINSGCRQASSAGVPCNGSKYYSDYHWLAFDINNPTERIDLQYPNEDFFIGSTNNKCVTINRNHPYFLQFEPGELAMFRVQLEVEDYAGFHDGFSKLISLNTPLRINLPEFPEMINRCPKSISELSLDPIVTGGSGNYTCTWTDISGILSSTSDCNPLLDLTGITSGTFDLLLDVDDDNGCHISSNTVKVNVSEISISEVPDIGYACYSGPGANRLGAEVSGGSGSYSYLWSPGTYLDDPYSLDPLIQMDVPGPSEGISETYVLEVTDEFGCSSESNPITINSMGAEGFPADAGEDKNVCFGTGVTLGVSQPNNGVDGYVVWTSDNELFEGSNDPTPTIPKEVNSEPGTYTYTVQAIAEISGCIDEDEVIVNVHDEWLHTGYESNLHYLVEGEQALLWDNNYDNYFLPNSGHQPPLTWSWNPLNGPQPYSVVNNDQNNIPAKEGFFDPTEENPFITLRVRDGLGCFKDLRTNRYVILEAQPQINISSDQGVVACYGEEMCFDIELDANFIGDESVWLPPWVTVDCSVGQYVELNLVNGKGLYQGSFCFTPQLSPYQPGVNRTITVSTIEGGLFEGLSESYLYQLGEPDEVPYKDYACGFLQDVQSGPFFTYTSPAMNILVGKGYQGGCSVTNIAPYAELVFKAGTNITFYPDHEFNTIAGGQIFAYIDPCLVEEFTEDPDQSITPPLQDSLITEERAKIEEEKLKERPRSAAGLKVYPNPFTGEVTLEYTIQAALPTNVTLSLLDLTGRRIYLLFKDKEHTGGKFKVTYDGSKLPPGMYFYELRTNQNRSIKRAIKAKF
jgi:PKD repeat protein